MRKNTFLKFLDRTFGKVIAFLVPKVKTYRYSRSQVTNRILFIRPGGIGDAVLLIPSLIAIKKQYPRVTTDILAEKRNSSIFLLSPAVNRIFYYDKPLELLSAVKGKYDVVIDTEQWHRLSAVVARLTRSSIAVGFATNERKKLLTHPIPYSQEDYELESFSRLLNPLSVPLPVDLEKPFLTVPQATSSWIRSLLKSMKTKRIVALFPGGSIPERRWGAERFHQVAKELINNGYCVLVVGGREDGEAGCTIAAGLENAMTVCGSLSLVETAAILKESALLITGDSGIMHVGFGLGIKTLSLFGPGIEKKWAPRGPGHFAINKNLPCSPCTKFGYTPKCKRNAECMKRITVDEVVQKALQILEG